MSESLLKVENIHTYYGAAQILDGVSFEVAAGSCVGILGRNGVGKTTLVRSLIGFTPPARGRIQFRGADITGHRPRDIVRSGMAIVPQGRRIFASLTVEEHLKIATSRRTLSAHERAWDLERVYELFPRLKERRKQLAVTMSGGEKQMLAIGRALMTCPILLLLDEPTEGLAPIIVDDVVRTLKELRQSGVSLLLVEQRVEVALRLADRVIVMTSRGEITFNGAPADFNADNLMTLPIPP